jgi:hypothetical protein
MENHPPASGNQPVGGNDEFTQGMVDLAAEGVDFFEVRFDGFDYSVASLAVIDELLEEASDFFEDMDSERQDQIVEQIGAYIFEVARRNFGGRYFWYDARNQPILVTGLPDFEISLLAYDKVRGRLENGAEDNIPFFFEGYADRVKNAKPGDMAMIV